MEHKPSEQYKHKLPELSLDSQEEYHRINCPSCSKSVVADNINIQDKIAKCNTCDIVFPFGNKLNNLLSSSAKKHEVMRPEGVERFEFKDELELSVQQPLQVFDLFYFIFFPIFSIFPIIAVGVGGVSPIWLMLPILFLIYPIWYFLNRKKSKVYIVIDEKKLHIEWRPKKMKKDKSYFISEIDQLYVKKSATSQGSSLNMIVNGIDGQKHITLIDGFTSISVARFLEQEIEKYLDITDRRVPEES